MPGSNKTVVSISMRRDLREWANRTGVVISTFVNALFDMLRSTGTVAKTKDSGEARVYIIAAVLRELGLNVTARDVYDLLNGRKRIVVEEVV